MIIKKFVPLFLVVLCFFSSVSAQEKTNIPALRQAAILSAERDREVDTRVASLAKLRGWPLSIKLKKGNIAILSRVSPRGMPVYVSTNDNIISAATIGTNQLWPGGSTGLNLTGSTIPKGKLAIWDGGRVRGTHQELATRIVQVDNPPAAFNDHSTHVSGTLIAKGVNPVAKGMSFGALQLNAYDFNHDVTEMFAAAPNLLISNHSYGELAGWNFNEDDNRWEFLGDPGDTVDYKFGYYSDQTQQWDSIAYNAPLYLIVKSVGNNRDVNGPAVGQPYFRYDASGAMVSAGKRPVGISSNDGYDIVPTYGTAKNIISIGAVNPIPGGYNSPSDVILAEFSSWGPADDGRIKPDLVADGINVLSCIGTSDNAYAIYSGTSMSSPASAGSAFLLQEYYSRLHGGAFMRSATLKGILIHTADEAGSAPGPDYQFGYGLIDMPKAASVITSDTSVVKDQIIQENSLTNASGTYSFPVIASGKGPLTVTICWTDPPAAVDEVFILNNHKSKLVNDLDLRVTGNSTTYMPWVLNRVIPWNPATTGDDTVNNVEKIQILNTLPGVTYTISVTHKGTLRSGSQAYSLIASGVGSTTYCASASQSSTGTQIDQVSIGNVTVTSPTACSTYTDNTSHTISLQSSQSFPFSIKLKSCDGSVVSRIVKIFVDYNNNGTFTDPGETAVVSPVLDGGVTTFTGNLVVPAGMQIGNNTRLRIVAEETTDPTLVLPCGNYPLGETEDYTAAFVNVANDVGMNAVVNPLPGSCQEDSQRISVRIQNSGTAAQANVPIRLKIISQTATLMDITTVYPVALPAQSSAVYTFQPSFRAIAGTTYIIQVSTLLPGDQNSLNDTISDTVQISAGSEIIDGKAEICSTSPPLAGLKANTIDVSDAVSWFDSPTATTAIATGIQATTTTIPSDRTYYLGLNEVAGSVGPKSKLDFPSGGYNNFHGNFLRIHNDVPLTITTARLYIGAGGKVDLIVGDLASFDSCTGNYQWFTISENIIDVYPTTPNPSRVAADGNSPLDTGAVFLLNLPIPTPGDHVLILNAVDDSAYVFRNNNISKNPYPMGMPGIFTITGNSVVNTSNCKDTTFYRSYYYFFYDMQIALDKCPSPRVPVVATTPAKPIITKIGNLLSSSSASGNQWYYGDSLIGIKDTVALIGAGSYTLVVTDSVGCALVSDVYTNTPGNDIGLAILPNPNHGIFTVEFYQAEMANADLRVLDINGQAVYQYDYPNFKGSYSRTINLGTVSGGYYVMQLRIGNKNYVKKVLVLP